MIHRRAKVKGDLAVGGEGFSDLGIIKSDYPASGRVKGEGVGVE